jgi:hypothetical protein
MDFEVFYVHRLDDGELARLEMFFDREQARAAAVECRRVKQPGERVT